ncbi:FxDxF family PEP-CTERM protein [Paucibacter soli]|uniref:FxDxF family PEP-CTERM protein n=1 Tax=Paucibacter soli TaxID=3133433 RepID=UPI003096DDE2
MIFRALSTLALAASALAGNAWAKPAPAAVQPAACGATSMTFVDCAGSFSGNLTGALSQSQIDVINAKFGDNGFHYSSASMVYSKSDAIGNGVFADDGKDFSLNFDQGLVAKGLFVIGLKQASSYSFYLIDGGSQGLSSFNIDVKGVVNGAQQSGLSHAVYIGNALAPVPEPQSYALMLAGLCAVGFIAKRRAQR